jgi:hypothetical protein
MAKRLAIIAAARAGRDSQLTFAEDDLEKAFVPGLTESGENTATNLAKTPPRGVHLGRPPLCVDAAYPTISRFFAEASISCAKK